MTSEPEPVQTRSESTHKPVFVSYAGEDLAVAEKVCRILELEGIDCWIAPRNVRPGRDYGEQIIEAIEAAPALVLILSASTNASLFIPSEVERAVSKEKAVFVLRIGQVRLSPVLEGLAAGGQSIDAWKPPLQTRVYMLADAIRRTLGLPPSSVVRSRSGSGRLSRRPLLGLGLAGIGLAALAVVALIAGLLPLGSRNAAPTHSQPGFYRTGSMAVGRSWHTSTLLRDGRVLIAGGWDGSSTFASAELYDPGTGAFSPTGSMTTARGGHTATLLSNGKVLITGGAPDGSVSSTVASAELYDPETGAFQPTGSMSQARENHTATLLSGGDVLIAGGDDGSAALSSAELYDPGIGAFSPIEAMTDARTRHTATLLNDGDVLIAGGSDSQADNATVLKSAEVYETDYLTFVSAGEMTSARSDHTATLLTDGRVLMAGGVPDSTGMGQQSAETYVPRTNSFIPTGAMSHARYLHTATRLNDGRVLVAGGVTTSGGVAEGLTSAEAYDPVSGTFSSAGSTVYPRAVHVATLLKDGRVLITGGRYLPPQTTASASPSQQGSTASTEPSPQPRLATSELYQP